MKNNSGTAGESEGDSSLKPQIGDKVIFVTCAERATIRFFVGDIAVCSSNQCGIVLVPISQIGPNHRKESKSWRADVHYHKNLYNVEGDSPLSETGKAYVSICVVGGEEYEVFPKHFHLIQAQPDKKVKVVAA